MAKRLEDCTTVTCLDHLYEVPNPEDPTPGYGHCYPIIAETPEGYAFRLDTTLTDNSHWEYDEEGFGGGFFYDATVILKVEALLKRIQAHLDKGGKLDPAHWEATQGSYSSPDWTAYEMDRDYENGDRQYPW